MVPASKSGQTAHDMRENGQTIWRAAVANSGTLMGMYISVNGIMTKPMVREGSITKMAPYTKASGEMTFKTATVSKHGLTEVSLRACTAMA